LQVFDVLLVMRVAGDRGGRMRGRKHRAAAGGACHRCGRGHRRARRRHRNLVQLAGGEILQRGGPRVIETLTIGKSASNYEAADPVYAAANLLIISWL
jgi:hypothetical protein